jgi:hypothetical protein
MKKKQFLFSFFIAMATLFTFLGVTTSHAEEKTIPSAPI